jgi:hypothetical protein
MDVKKLSSDTLLRGITRCMSIADKLYDELRSRQKNCGHEKKLRGHDSEFDYFECTKCHLGTRKSRITGHEEIYELIPLNRL